MSLGFGEWEIEAPNENNPVLTKRREGYFVQLALGLARFHNHPDAERLTAVFETSGTTDQEKQQAINQLRSIIKQTSLMPSSRTPMLGYVLGEAYILADMEDQEAASKLQLYLHEHRPPPPYIRRTRPAEEVA